LGYLADYIFLIDLQNFPKVGSPKPNYHLMENGIKNLTFLVLTPVNRSQSGGIRDGFIPKIREDGSSGIADIIWGVEPMMMNDKSKDGQLCKDTLFKLKIIVERAVHHVASVNGKHYCIGRMILESYNYSPYVKNYFINRYYFREVYLTEDGRVQNQ
jgi:hypothetical protein